MAPDFSLGQGKGCWKIMDKREIGMENLLLLTILCDPLKKYHLFLILNIKESTHLLEPL